MLRHCITSTSFISSFLWQQCFHIRYNNFKVNLTVEILKVIIDYIIMWIKWIIVR